MTQREAVRFITQTEGKIFSVEFRKRTPPHDLRVMVCRTGVKKGLKEEGELKFNPAAHKLLIVFDMQADGYRSIPLDGITRIKVAGEWQEVTGGLEDELDDTVRGSQ